MKFETDMYSIDEYADKSRFEYFKYIYGNETAEEVLNNVINLSKIYYFSFSSDSNYSTSGLVIFILYIIFSLAMFLSIIFLFKKNSESKFEFLPKGSWILTFIGNFIILSGLLTQYGKLTSLKCKLRIISLNFGFFLYLTPIFYKLIINFSSDGKFIHWVERNKKKSISLVLFFDLILNILFLFSKINLNKIIIINGESFERCKVNGTFGLIIFYCLLLTIGIALLIMLVFIFLEWNIIETYFDLRFLISGNLMDILLIILFIVINYLNIDNFHAYAISMIGNIFFFALTNYIFLYAYRLISKIIQINEEEKFIISFLRKNEKYKESTFETENENCEPYINSNNTDSCNSINRIRESPNKILQYHYRNSK